MFTLLLWELRREFWQHRATFIVLPAATAGFVIASLLLVFLGLMSGGEISLNIEVSGKRMDSLAGFLQSFAQMSEFDRNQRLGMLLRLVAWPMGAVLWLVVVLYLLGTLYDERKDRSLLFWKSLPVPDWMCVLSKLLTAGLAVPLIYLVVTMIAQLVALALLATWIATDEPDSTALWSSVWSASGIIGQWGLQLASTLFHLLWSLPFLAWLLLVSAWVRSVPLVWAVIVPLGLSIVDSIFGSGQIVGRWLFNHGLPMGHLTELNEGGSLAVLQERLFSVDFVVAVAFGGVLLAGAWLMRGRADEI